MIETTISNAVTPAGTPAGTPADKGLRSAPGIRWLLLAGALVTGVSVYRLVEAQWTAIPVPVQFLVLVAGALGIFGLGRVTRSRLHLPYAGSALLFLFTGLVPVLAWGAAYLRLLDTVWGWIAFSAGGAVLLGAAAVVMRSELRYPGRLYPITLGLLFAAQAVLPRVGEVWLWSAEGLYVLAALALGAVLHVGSRHVNRFFFHRDRQDGRERSVHFVPFALLGILYVGALAGLDLESNFRALPLALLGLVLAGTGEEYYRALSESIGHAPRPWPRRSLALMAVGCSLVVAALPLALEDPSGRCLLLTAAGAAALFLRWSLRYGQPAFHVLGVLAAFVAWNNLPFLAPFRRGGMILFGWNEAGFLAGLIALGVLLRHRRASTRLHRIHDALTALLLAGIAVLALLDVSHGTLLLAVAGAAGLGAGYGLRDVATFLAGGLMLSAGAHAEVFLRLDGPGPWTALLTQALFVLSWLASRRLQNLRGSLLTLALFHGFAALGWLGWAASESTVTVEPLILLLAGIALVWNGLAERQLEGHEGIDLGLALALAWAPVQLLFSSTFASWSAALVAGLTLAGLELGALIFTARRAPGHWLARRFGLEVDDWNVLTALSLGGLTRAWLVMAAAACLLLTGWDALILALTLVAVRYLSRTEIEGWARRFAFPARLTLLPLLQLAVLAAAGGLPERDLPSAAPVAGPEPAPLDRRPRSRLAGADREPRRAQVSATVEPRRPGRHGLRLPHGLLRRLRVFSLDARGPHRARHGLGGGRLPRRPAGPRLRPGLADAGLGRHRRAPRLHRRLAPPRQRRSPPTCSSPWAPPSTLWGPSTRSGTWAPPSPPPAAWWASVCRSLPASSRCSVSLGPGLVWFPALATFLVSLFYTVVASRETRRASSRQRPPRPSWAWPWSTPSPPRASGLSSTAWLPAWASSSSRGCCGPSSVPRGAAG